MLHSIRAELEIVLRNLAIQCCSWLRVFGRFVDGLFSVDEETKMPVIGCGSTRKGNRQGPRPHTSAPQAMPFRQSENWQIIMVYNGGLYGVESCNFYYA